MVDRPVPISDRDPDAAPPPRALPNTGFVVYPPRATFGPRLQRDYQLVLVHAGAARVTVDGAGRDIPSGHVGLLRPGHKEVYAFGCDGETRHSWIAVPPRALDDAARAALDAAPDLLPLSTALEAYVEVGRGTVAVDEPERRPVLTAVGRAALALYVAEGAHAPLAQTRVHPAVARARLLARARAHEGIGVDELARDVGVSPEHLVRLFRRDLATTPGAILRAERLAHATRLLAQTGLSVAEVAHRSGFASPHHLAHCLRAATGRTPTELRARSWAARET
jgi:AraC-like DNA-binding protein